MNQQEFIPKILMRSPWKNLWRDLIRENEVPMTEKIVIEELFLFLQPTASEENIEIIELTEKFYSFIEKALQENLPLSGSSEWKISNTSTTNQDSQILTLIPYITVLEEEINK